ncbi:hypothetical protein XELAEV_18033775mg [Xenopus laevis]|uniref:Uncharacterized protein n=1 Tax=Xenopus laevis TaxID=8355 RepID=A0A974CKZ7_XENLA|nr:hypothetical protein XELAEV_18033775mg [Xenopus laevis]
MFYSLYSTRASNVKPAIFHSILQQPRLDIPIQHLSTVSYTIHGHIRHPMPAFYKIGKKKCEDSHPHFISYF